MRLFRLVRMKDVSGVSGIGVIAEGCLFSSGKVAMAWLGEHHTIELFDHLEEVEEIHGHGGLTKVEWLDEKLGGCGSGKLCFCDLCTRGE